ncbi:MAG: efflux transporter outer membrane subunit [Syntrophobacteraceae bacterium]|nr:efflux transporter outer membrane subunit [Desulfobacteraceae bacterium]
MRRWFYVGLIVLVAGCMVGPDYRRPAVDAPASFRFEDEEARETANTQWWKQFEDPVLDSLIAEGLAKNKSVKIAAANIEQAAGVLTQTRSSLFPQVNYSGEALRQNITERGPSPVPSSIDNPQNYFQFLAGASWELDLWGRVRRLSEAARANLYASADARRGVILSLVSSIANTYIQLRSLDEQLGIANQKLKTYGESVYLFEQQFKYGQVSQMNVEQARSQYETAASTIPQLESQIAQTEHSICLLLGRNPGPIERGKSILELSPVTVPAGLPSQLLERRPDIMQAEQSLVAANAQIGAAKALYFPTISLTAGLGTASERLSDLFTGPANVWNFTGTITGPIFTAGAISGQVKQAEASREAALLGYQNAVQSAFRDVSNALIARKKLVDQIQAQERLVASLREYDRLAWLQYNGGYTPYLTVLNAEQQLFPAELNYVQVRASMLSASVTLYQAMGGGWVNEADRLTGQ